MHLIICNAGHNCIPDENRTHDLPRSVQHRLNSTQLQYNLINKDSILCLSSLELIQPCSYVCFPQPRDQASSDKSNTGRANRLLSDLAATLAEDNISLKRPNPDTDVAQRKVESAGGHAVKSQGYTTRSKEYIP